jgi:hypothetical protein
MFTVFDNFIGAFSALQGGADSILNFKGAWDADTNTPTLVSGGGSAPGVSVGDTYIVNVAGTTNLDGITDWQVTDLVIAGETQWFKIDNTETTLSNIVNLSPGETTLSVTNLNAINIAPPAAVASIKIDNSETFQIGTRFDGVRLSINDDFSIVGDTNISINGVLGDTKTMALEHDRVTVVKIANPHDWDLSFWRNNADIIDLQSTYDAGSVVNIVPGTPIELGSVHIHNEGPSLIELRDAIGFLRLTQMTTAQRDAIGGFTENGSLNYNLDTDKLEAFLDGSWQDILSSLQPIVLLNPAVNLLTDNNINAINYNQTGGNTTLRLNLIDDTFPAGTTFEMVRRTASETFEFEVQAGINLNGVSGGSELLPENYSRAIIVKIGTNDWQFNLYNLGSDSDDLQSAYDNGDGTIVQTAAKPLAIFSEEQSLAAAGAVINNPGSGYVGSPITGDILEIVGGTGRPIRLRVSIVGGSGEITQVLPIDNGKYSVLPPLVGATVTPITGSGVNATFDLTLETNGILQQYEGISQARGGITVGGGLTPILPDYAIADFGSQTAYNKTIIMPRLSTVQEDYVQTQLPQNGILHWNINLGRFRTSIANVARTIPIESDITLENAYTQGDGTISVTSGKPVVLNSTVDGFRIPEMTEAEFGAITAIDGLKAWTTDESREIHKRFGATDKVAYLSDIASIEEDVVFASAGFKNNATETVIAAPGVAVKVAGTYVTGKESGFTHAAGTITYNETEARTVKVEAVLTGSYNLVDGNISALIAQNGTVIEDSETPIDLTGTSPAFHLIVSSELVDLVQNDTLEVFVRNNNAAPDDTANITVEKIKFIVHSLGGASTGQNIDLQQAWSNSPDGKIVFNEGLKGFTTTELNGFTKILEAHPSTGVFMRATNTTPIVIGSDFTSIQHPYMKFEWANPGVGGQAGQLGFTSRTDDVNDTEYNLLDILCTTLDRLTAQQKTEVRISQERNGSNVEIIKFDPTNETIVLGDTVVPHSLTSGQIGPRPKVNGMIYRNSTDARLQYHEGGSEEVIANLNDLSDIASSGSGVITVNSTSANVLSTNVLASFYHKINNIVNFNATIFFEINAIGNTTITIDVPFTPNFTSTNQQSIMVQPRAVSNLGGILSDGSQSTVSFAFGNTIQIAMELATVSTINNSYALDISGFYEIQ